MAAEIYGHLRTLTDSTVSGNSTDGERRPGRRDLLRQHVTLTNSTVSGNSTAGKYAQGGGIFRQYRDADQQHGQRQQHGG